MMIRLVVYLKNGRTLSGTYPYMEALSRLDWARRQDGYAGFDLLGAI